MTLVTARCPECGGELQLDNKKENAFCMHCGSKIFVQEAIKAVRIDNTHMVETWMRMGDSSYEGGNIQEAYDYYKRVVEVQPDNWQAIYKKGKAAGWQSTLANLRFNEAVTSFGQAINLAPKDKQEQLKNDVNEEVKKLASAIIALRAERFIKWPDEDEASGFMTDIRRILEAVMQLNKISSFVASGFMNPIATIINSSVMAAWSKKIKPDYEGNDSRPGEYQFDKFIERIGYCTTLIKSSIGLSDEDEEEDIRAYKNLITLEDEAINACSWKFESEDWLFGKSYSKQYQLTNLAKQSRRDNINEYKAKIKQIQKKIAKENEEAQKEKRRILQKEEKRRFEEYWSENNKKRFDLEEEKAKIAENIIEIKKERDDDIYTLMQEIEEILDKKAQKEEILNSLGIFKGKEKKALQTEIDNLKNSFKETNLMLEERERPFQIKISTLMKRSKQIDDELTKPR